MVVSKKKDILNTIPIYILFLSQFILWAALSYWVDLMVTAGNLNKLVMLFSYSNPLVILGAINIFLIFKRIKVSIAPVNAVSTYIFAVYLLHYHAVVRNYFELYLNEDFFYKYMGGLIGIPVIALLILICGICVDYVVQKIVGLIFSKRFNSFWERLENNFIQK